MWIQRLRRDLPHHAAIIDGLARAVSADVRWRFLSVSCSLGRGNADRFSDIDAGIGFDGPIDAGDLERDAVRLAESAGDLLDALVHHWTGLADDERRIAAEYRSGVQLDLVFHAASRRTGRLPDEEYAVVDKDGRLDDVPRARLAARAALVPGRCREWSFLGWWAVSDTAKYLRRGSLFEAATRLETIREHALRLFAAAQGIRFPDYGLTSLLDYPPGKLPVGLAATYARPDDRAALAQAALAAADLLERCAARAASALGIDLDTPMASAVRQRLADAVASINDRCQTPRRPS